MEKTREKIGIVGGGQLGRMLTLAAQKLGFKVIVLDPTPESPAGQVADRQIVGSFKDGDFIRRLSEEVDFLTFEIESANAEALTELVSEGFPVNPSPEILLVIKDKLRQKSFLKDNKFPVPEFLEVGSGGDLASAGRYFGFPLVLKSRFDAYDGRGNFLVKTQSDFKLAFEKLGTENLYAEKLVNFRKELSVIVARGLKGEVVSYPPVETIHKNNICHTVFSPAPISSLLENKARDLACSVVEHLKGVGLFAIEMFLTEDEKIMINEIAPRVHNSGHCTIEAHKTSQFEQHIRAITGMSLGEVEMSVPAAVMVNILGERKGKAETKGVEKALEIPGVSVHIYGKLETRPERKMGHITAVDSDPDSALKKAKTARKYINI